MRRLVLLTIVLLGGLVGPRQALADPEPTRGDPLPLILSLPGVQPDGFAYAPDDKLVLDTGVIVGFPAALPTGLSRGIGVGFTAVECVFAWGARAAWVTATESTMAWTVTHGDLRLRATGELRHTAGRGTFGLRLGLGGTLVHESRTRNQGERAGLTGSDLATSTYAMLPAADLDAVVLLHIAGRWSMMLSGGPSLAVVDGGARASWASQLGVAWQP